MDFDLGARTPNTTKIILAELDISRSQTQWVNYAPFSWYVNLVADYPAYAGFTDGIIAVTITSVGSVTFDNLPLSRLESKSAVAENAESWYYDPELREVYVHLPDGDAPDLHRVALGEVLGVRRGSTNAVYNDFLYESRLTSIPSVSIEKDDAFWSKSIFSGGAVSIENADGKYDRFARDKSMFGNAARVLLGFGAGPSEIVPYSDFRPILSGQIGRVTTSATELQVEIVDKRSLLTKELPASIFDAVTYPHIKESGKPIPLGWGRLRNIPVTCIDEEAYEEEIGGSASATLAGKLVYATGGFTGSVHVGDTAYNETDETQTTVMGIDSDTQISLNADIFMSGDKFSIRAPGDYTFKIMDTSAHPMRLLSAVRVKDIAIPTPSLDTTTAIFQLGHFTYSPGDDVTCDCEGYTADDGSLIDNPLDVIRDMLTTYYPFNYNASFFNTSEWEIARSIAPAVSLHVADSAQVIDLIDGISASIFGNFSVELDGRFSYRIFSALDPSLQTIRSNELLETPTLEEDPAEVVSTVRVGYDQDRIAGAYRLLTDDSMEAEVYDRYKVSRSQEFDTLLVNEADAAAFAEKALGFYAAPKSTFQARTKAQSVERRIGDMVIVEVDRPTRAMIGTVKAEVIGIDKEELTSVTLTCRIVEEISGT